MLFHLWLYQTVPWWKLVITGIALFLLLWGLLGSMWYQPGKRLQEPYDPNEGRREDPTKPREDRAGYVESKLERLRR